MGDHSPFRYRISSLPRLLSCYASQAMIESYSWLVSDERSEAAEEGTVAHDVLEQCVLLGTSQIDDIVAEQLDKAGLYDANTAAAMAHYVKQALRRLDDLKPKGPDTQTFSEYRVSWERLQDWYEGEVHKPVLKQIGGTADLVYAAPGQLFVPDFKYGRWHAVDVKDNPQALGYLVGALCDPDVRRIIGPPQHAKYKIAIAQPRVATPFTEQNVTFDDVLDFVGRALRSVSLSHAIVDLDVPTIQQACKPSRDACMYCDASGICQSASKYIQTEYMNAQDIMEELSRTRALDDEQVGRLAESLASVKLMEKFAKSVKDFARNLAFERDLPGYKLVAGNAARSWVDDTQVDEIIESQGLRATERRSVASVEKELKQHKKTLEDAGLDKYISISRKRPMLVSEKDARPSIRQTPEELAEIFGLKPKGDINE